jgi:hypothetical protein
MVTTRASQSKPPKKTKEQQQYEALEAKFAALEKENRDQKLLLEAKTSGKRSSTSVFVAKIPVDKALAARIVTTAGAQGHTLWRTTKFLNTDEEIEAATRVVMEDLPECRKLLEDTEEKVNENVKAFYDTYGNSVAKGVNDQRNNAQTGLKVAYIERYDQNKGQDMPDPNELLNAILRKDLELPKKIKEPTAEDFPDDDAKFQQAKVVYSGRLERYRAKVKQVRKNRDIFKWYWLSLLPKVCGNKRWGQTIRLYGTISGHGPVGKKVRYVTSSDEALVQVLYENCGQRFPYLASLPRKKYTTEELEEQKKHELYGSMYSDNTVGQQKIGGWNKEGRERFYALNTHIREVRRDPKVKAVEEDILAEIQEEMGLNKKKGKKRKGPPEEVDMTKSEAFVPICIESDAYDSDDEVLKKQKAKPLAAFVPNYRSVAQKKKKGKGKKGRNARKKDDEEEDEDEDEDEEEEDDDE